MTPKQSRHLAVNSHGHTNGRSTTPTYNTWAAMRERCKTNLNYIRQGITVCPRWQESFRDFLADMGERPAGKTLDRWPNQNGNYEPGNCRWATKIEQQNNMRSNIVLEFGPFVGTLQEWCTALGKDHVLVSGRYGRDGKRTYEALFSPPDKTKRRTRSEMEAI